MKKIFFLFFLLTASVMGMAQKIPAKPNPPKLVNDYAGVLSAAEVQQLEQQLVAYDDSTSNQIAIVLLKTLDGYPKEEFANKLFREWGIGNKKTNNGVLILAAIDDRQMWIEVGYGLEGAIPDITANHIYEDDIKPNFRSGDYFKGLQTASEHIIKAAAGEYSAPKDYRKGKGGGKGGSIGFIIFIVIMIILFAGRGRGGGGGGGFMSRRGYRGGWLGPLILGNILGGGGSSGGWGSSGGSGWSGGGGGFGGFGGGSSGGGGAGGSW